MIEDNSNYYDISNINYPTTSASDGYENDYTESLYTPHSLAGGLHHPIFNGLSVIIDNVSYKDFKANKICIQNISFIARSGCITGIVGSVKSGKTVLLKCIAGLYPCVKQNITGSVYCVCLNADPHIPQRLIYVSSNAKFCNYLTILEYLIYVVRFIRTELDETDRNSLICRILKDVDLWLYRNEYINSKNLIKSIDHSSKRLALAIAVIQKAKVIVFDKIVSNYDSSSFPLILLLKKIATKYQCCIICSQSRLHHKTLDLYDQIVVLDNGTMVYAGQPSLIVPYFEEVSPYRCPVTWTAMEFVMDVLSKSNQKGINNKSFIDFPESSSKRKNRTDSKKLKLPDCITLSEIFEQSLIYQNIKSNIHELNSAGPKLVMSQATRRPFKLIDSLKRFKAVIHRLLLVAYRRGVILLYIMLSLLFSIILLILLSWKQIPSSFDIKMSFSRLQSIFASIIPRDIKFDENKLLGILRVIDLGPKGDGVYFAESALFNRNFWDLLDNFQKRIRFAFLIPYQGYNFNLWNNLLEETSDHSSVIENDNLPGVLKSLDISFLWKLIRIIMQYVDIIYYFLFSFNVKPLKKCFKENELCDILKCLKKQDDYLVKSVGTLFDSYNSHNFNNFNEYCRVKNYSRGNLNMSETDISSLSSFLQYTTDSLTDSSPAESRQLNNRDLLINPFKISKLQNQNDKNINISNISDVCKPLDENCKKNISKSQNFIDNDFNPMIDPLLKKIKNLTGVEETDSLRMERSSSDTNDSSSYFEKRKKELELILLLKSFLKEKWATNLFERVMSNNITNILNSISQIAYDTHKSDNFVYAVSSYFLQPYAYFVKFSKSFLEYINLVRHIQVLIQFTVILLGLFLYIFLLEAVYMRSYSKYEVHMHFYPLIVHYTASFIIDTVLLVIPATIIALTSYFSCGLYFLKSHSFYVFLSYWLGCYLTILASSGFGVLLASISPNSSIAFILVPITFVPLATISGFPLRTFFPLNNLIQLKAISFYHWSYNYLGTVIFYNVPQKSALATTVQRFLSNVRGIPSTTCMAFLILCAIVYRLLGYIIEMYFYSIM